MGYSIKLDKIDIKMRSGFSIWVIVSVELNSLAGTLIESKSKRAKFLNQICSLVYSILNRSIFFKLPLS